MLTALFFWFARVSPLPCAGQVIETVKSRRDAIAAWNNSAIEHMLDPDILAQQPVPDGVYGQRYHSNSIIPLLSKNQFLEFPWAQWSNRVEYILYNYTVYKDPNGINRSRWLKREFVPRYLSKRGYGTRFDLPNDGRHKELPWPASGPGCPAIIILCFEEKSDVDALHNLVSEAVKVWHTKLGVDENTNGRSGVQFKIKDPPMCGPPINGVPDRKVHIKVGKDGERSTTLGFNLDWTKDEHNMEFDPDEAHGGHGGHSVLADMVHELGHTLGLQHEQNRVDADQHIIVVYEYLPGFKKVNDFLTAHPIPNPRSTKTPKDPLTWNHICSDNRFAKRFMPGTTMTNGDVWEAPDHEMYPEWDAWEFMPWKYSKLKELGPFNIDSIMIYSTEQASGQMVRKDNGGPIFQGSEPNDLDVQAVKMIYPDLASSPDAPAADDSDVEMEDTEAGAEEGEVNEQVIEI